MYAYTLFCECKYIERCVVCYKKKKDNVYEYEKIRCYPDVIYIYIKKYIGSGMRNSFPKKKINK